MDEYENLFYTSYAYIFFLQKEPGYCGGPPFGGRSQELPAGDGSRRNTRERE